MTVAEASQKCDGDYRRFAFRTPAWRWTFALEHLRLKSRLRPWEDAAIKEATRYLRERQRARTARQLSKVKDRSSDLTKAHDIFLADGVLRHELEARLIAGETFEVIATKSSTAAGVVAAFERYFFNVADALGALDWMLVFAVGVHPGLDRKPTESECWRYMALAGGSVFVDLLIDDHLGRPNPAFSNLHELAEKGRFVVRDYMTAWWKKKSGAATLKAGLKLLGPHWGISDEMWTPTLEVAMKFLRWQYGLGPRRKSQRQIEQIEATYCNNHRSIFNVSPIPSQLRQSAPIHPGPPGPPISSSHQPSGSVVNDMGSCGSVAAVQENVRQMLHQSGPSGPSVGRSSLKQDSLAALQKADRAA